MLLAAALIMYTLWSWADGPPTDWNPKTPQDAFSSALMWYFVTSCWAMVGAVLVRHALRRLEPSGRDRTGNSGTRNTAMTRT
jgi:hypothetical protein